MSFCAGLLLHAALAGDIEPTDEDFAWQDEHAFTELERLMPVKEELHAGIVFRTFRDLYYDVVETYFRIGVDLDAPARRLRARLVVPADVSIQEQLLRLHMSDRDAPIEALRSQLRVDAHELTEAECPAMRKRWEAFSKLRVPLPSEERLYRFHPIVYTIRSARNDGTFDAWLNNEKHDLVHWALQTHDELLRCAAQRAKRGS